LSCGFRWTTFEYVKEAISPTILEVINKFALAFRNVRDPENMSLKEAAQIYAALKPLITEQSAVAENAGTQPLI
jgi:hypothetical protein